MLVIKCDWVVKGQLSTDTQPSLEGGGPRLSLKFARPCVLLKRNTWLVETLLQVPIEMLKQ